MSKVKQLTDYLRGVCIHFADLQEICPLPDDPPLPVADFVSYRIEDGKCIITRFCEGCQENEEDVIEPGVDFIYIGNCPEKENPFGLYPTSRICQAYIIQLRNVFGKEPKGAKLYAKYERGEDGYTVCCEYTCELPYSVAYAFMIESQLQEYWTPAAKRYLETGQ